MEPEKKKVKKVMGLTWETWVLLMVIIGSIPLVNFITLPLMFFLLLVVGILMTLGGLHHRRHH